MAVPPLLTLNNSVTVPQLGFGVYKVHAAEAEKVVSTAIEAGYRSIDTATLYGNEAEVGAAVRASGLPREEFFVTTKLWNSDHGYDNALRAFDRSTEALGLGVVDLYLIHWPQPGLDRYVETWRALEQLLRDGRVRAIGVSNFGVAHLRRLLDETDVVPAVNQVELHPWLQQAPLREFHAAHGIATEAWGPLARGRMLGAPVLTALAAKYGKTPAQLVLRWHLQLGTIAIPKSAHPARMRENLAVFDFELAEDDLAALAELDDGTRTGPDPDRLG
ncbi:aldo/keto reductase [Amycolatopsis jiangsuensis]|uniref:Diketogulonate reductase-like aldo/keto reductase n=1 Tax=Amycolatopsis jiangsuensis TaxID=1181879 RepID=A0A840IP06_9PSEU|nr:aldo/keto reductase [Amycolatopsis jiangsuensis]MBB4683680.1 diketogulonate reductase-like aldo/keto reductase [Amycolatopsis jiangsuensis]